MPSYTGSRPISQVKSTSVRNALLANAIRLPVPIVAKNDFRCSPFTAAGRACTPKRTNSADSTNVAASTMSARRGSSVRSSAPPPAKPTSCAVWIVMLRMPMPTTNRSPSSTCGSNASCDALNGGFSSETQPTSTHIAQNGITGTATSRISAARRTSTSTITLRRGNRSANPVRKMPPSSEGANVSA